MRASTNTARTHNVNKRVDANHRVDNVSFVMHRMLFQKNWNEKDGYRLS